jgi:hypothetical protein
MLTETQWDQLDAIFADNGRSVRMLAKDAYIIVDANHARISRDEYASHEQAALALINGTYARLAVRVDSGVQHGAKNKVQWARKTQGKVNVMNGGSL